jgi:hypothetical protein
MGFGDGFRVFETRKQLNGGDAPVSFEKATHGPSDFLRAAFVLSTFKRPFAYTEGTKRSASQFCAGRRFSQSFGVRQPRVSHPLKAQALASISLEQINRRSIGV